MHTLPDTNSPQDVILDTRLAAGTAFVDLELRLLRKPADPWPEAGWISLPLNVNNPRFRLARLGGVVDPVRDFVPGSNHQLFALHGGLAVIDASGHGVGLCAIDSPLVSLGEPGCWRYTPEFTSRPATVYVNVFNNQWTTNFRLWNDATPKRPWTSRVRLWTFDRYDHESALVTPSMEARHPLLASVASGPAGRLPTAQTGLGLSRKGVLITAFGHDPDGGGTLLRLWEQAGIGGKCEVRLPAGLTVKRAQPVDLRGRPIGKPSSVNGRRLDVVLKPWAPVTLVLQ